VRLAVFMLIKEALPNQSHAICFTKTNQKFGLKPYFCTLKIRGKSIDVQGI